MANRKKYSALQKYEYHNSRQRACSRYGIEHGGKQYNYSAGFTDGVDGIDNRKPFKSGSYNLGFERGKKARYAVLKEARSLGKDL